MSQKITTIEKSAIEYLCGLIRELSNVSEGIDDINLRSDGTFSSVKIDTLLNNLESECNEYTDRLVANLSRLELKIVTNEADINKSNILYLHKPDGATSYNQYVVIEGNKVLLGTTDISMTDYYTITQADAKFCLLTDYNSLKTAYETHKNDTDIHITSAERTKWDKTSTDFTTHTGDTVAHMTQTEKDNIVKKDDIVSNLDSTVTNTQLIDGKTLVDKFNSIDSNFSRRYNFDNIRHKRTIDRRLAIKAVIDTFKKDGASITSIDYYEKNSVFIIRYNQGYYYTYIMTSYFNKVFILEYSVYNTDMILWVEDETGELYIRGTIPITGDVIRFVKPFTTNKDKYKLYDGQYTIDENTKTCTLTVSIDCLSPVSTSTNFGTLKELNFKTPSSPRTFDLKAEGTSTDTIKFYLGEMYCQIWGGTAGKRYTGTVTYTIK